ncbi:MAG: 5-formyltetrahydrofolate cyclo-ligase [Alphaproteobacteria bacterium]|nr:5-formyltetrahydrofolate cyclo-ligase [Alphaproteobacteria bacterium]
MSQKDVLRAEAVRNRERIDPASEDPDAIVDLFLTHVKPAHDQIIALYWPKGREFDPYALLERLLRDGFVCSLPVVKKETRVLSFARWDETIPLAEGPFGVMQPAAEEPDSLVEPDILCVPFLAFDRRGQRLGYGGGYYDATIRALRDKKELVAVGLGYAQQAVLFNLPREDHDEMLDWVVTPQGVHRFAP